MIYNKAHFRDKAGRSLNIRTSLYNVALSFNGRKNAYVHSTGNSLDIKKIR